MWAVTVVQRDHPTVVRTDVYETREQGAAELIDAFRVFAPTNARVKLELHGHGAGHLDAVHSDYYLSEIEPMGGVA